MNIWKKIHVTDYMLNDHGIAVSYRIRGRYYHLVIAREFALAELESIGSSLQEGLSQHDAILIVSRHEQNKEAQPPLNLDNDPLFRMIQGINRQAAM